MLYVLGIALNIAVYIIGIITLGVFAGEKLRDILDNKKSPEKDAEAETKEGEV